MSIPQILADLRGDLHFMANVVAWRTLDAQAAQWAPMPPALHPALQNVLQQRGIQQLYSHQAQAVDLALNGHNLVIVTPTASGKTLCYNLPVLHSLLNDPAARALYLFPTKALAQDQLAELYTFATHLETQSPPPLSPLPPFPPSPLPPSQITAYDGDTLRPPPRYAKTPA
ncbi:MAG: DEAD/DEAH box helicase [Caldilineaceae bacterium]